MKAESTPIPPPNLYVAVNVPLAIAWALGVPILSGFLLAWPGWVIGLTTVAWLILNTRIVDRYLPVHTAPAIRAIHRVYFTIVGSKK
jgi:hypothetical protein